ncbi:MAG: hypothetical protein GY953_19090 [bacterium]|nr:hypothetical protein [bacterium]
MGPDVLLQPVGSFKGDDDGEEPIFDLGGNVAEWMVTAEGEGKAMGGSADRPADKKWEAEPRPAFVGFRVVSAGNQS